MRRVCKGFSYHSSLITRYLGFVYVWQGLFGSRPRRWLKEQPRHFRQLIQSRARADVDLVWLRGSAMLNFDNFADIKSGGIDSVLSGCKYVVSGLDLLQTGNVTHLDQT